MEPSNRLITHSIAAWQDEWARFHNWNLRSDPDEAAWTDTRGGEGTLSCILHHYVIPKPRLKTSVWVWSEHLYVLLSNHEVWSMKACIISGTWSLHGGLIRTLQAWTWQKPSQSCFPVRVFFFLVINKNRSFSKIKTLLFVGLISWEDESFGTFLFVSLLLHLIICII